MSPPTEDEPSSGSEPQKQWARAADWERHRETITELYRDQGLHLDEVVAIMARDHSFNANQRMYKTRIKKWGIDKNQKAWEVARILRLKRERDVAGKESEFVVRGRKLEWNKIEQYLKREPVLMRKLETYDGKLEMVVGQSSGIICRTPSPDPAAAFSVPPAPVASVENRLPEEIARLARDYYVGAVENGVWIQVSEGSWASRRGPVAADQLRAWGNRMRSARHLIATGGLDEGFERLGICLDELTQVIRDEDPSLLFHLIGNTMGLTPSGKDLGAALTKHIRDLAAIILGQQHPLTIIFDKINAMVKSKTHFMSVPIPMRCLMDLFEARGGAMDEQSQALYKRFLDLLGKPAHQQDPDDQGTDLQDIIDFLEGSRNIHVNLRFHFTYLSYLSSLLVQKEKPPEQTTTQQPKRGSPIPVERKVIRFREAKYFYMFNADVLASTETVTEEAADILWEVDGEVDKQQDGICD